MAKIELWFMAEIAMMLVKVSGLDKKLKEVNRKLEAAKKDCCISVRTLNYQQKLIDALMANRSKLLFENELLLSIGEEKETK